MYKFKFADIGEGIHEGKILEYNYKVGDMIKEGETLVTIETDKVNAEIPIPVDGKIIELGPNEGEIVKVGQVLAVIDDGLKDTKNEDELPEKDNEEAGVVGELEISEEVIASSHENIQTEQKPTRVLATPLARKLASDLGVDINHIKGSGEHGRVLRTDIEDAKNNIVETPKTSTKIFEIPSLKFNNLDKKEKISMLRKSVVKAMTLSKKIIPHTTLIDEFDVSELVKFRNQYKEMAKTQGVKLTYMAFIIKALVETISKYPVFNSSYDEENEEIIYRKNINTGIAVDTADGLIVPNIKNAETLSLFEIANEVERLATLAKERKIQLSDLQDGTITITNFGAFDALSGTPIIKHPEVAILGIGKIVKKPVVVNDEIVIRDIIHISLTFDHRIIDGADGGRFMLYYKKYLNNPLLLLME
ncbi:MAG: dihydrolipoamide acetyltransferase family protein [Candidatus Izemoplasmatales bacterium]